ncbi:hypothetical protein GE21DRAFT_1209037, partial [Neurospora crassa]
IVSNGKWCELFEKREKNDQVIESMLRVLERRNFGYKNGIFNVRCHPADRSTF